MKKKIESFEKLNLFVIVFCIDRGCDGKFVAVDILHFDGHPWGFLRDESNSRCAVRVSVEKNFVLHFLL